MDELLSKVQNDSRGPKQNLDSLLIMPIQRLPRYVMLLQVSDYRFMSISISIFTPRQTNNLEYFRE
jgi:hypothetical protein